MWESRALEFTGVDEGQDLEVKVGRGSQKRLGSDDSRFGRRGSMAMVRCVLLRSLSHVWPLR